MVVESRQEKEPSEKQGLAPSLRSVRSFWSLLGSTPVPLEEQLRRRLAISAVRKRSPERGAVT